MLHQWAQARIPLYFLFDGGGPSADLRFFLFVLAPALPRPCPPTLGHAVVNSMYATSRVRMAMVQEPSGSGGTTDGHEGCFVV